MAPAPTPSGPDPHGTAGPGGGLRRTGIDVVGDAPWGTHFCQFYATKQDLADVLVPYFKAGLEADELCMWVTSPPLGADEAWAALARAVPDLEGYRARGRIEILPHTAWYLAGGGFDQDRVLAAWVAKLHDALARGCAGLRLSGNTFWLERSDWRSFTEYEAAIDRVLGQYRMLALCTYSLDRCGASEIADVIRNHQFALMKREGRWEMLESFDRRRMQDALAAERERLMGSLRETTRRLEDADRRKDGFLAVLSHELRNPLAPIRNSIHVLERAAPGSERAERSKAVLRRQTEHLTRLVDDLLDVTRISRGKIELQRARVDLRDVVRKATDDLRSEFDRHGVVLHVEHRVGPVWVDADATRLAQVVGNLLANAVKFTPSGGTVEVAVAASGDRAELTVRDDGIGMDPAEVERMFEPFAQAQSAPGRGKGGLGLGLALVKGLVQLHGGAVRARSEGPGHGSEFVVTLPRTAPRFEARSPEGPAAVEARCVVLVIEDNPDVGQSVADLLELHGHRVTVVRDGRAGLAAARELRPDVIVCDIGLPDLDGYEVARALRRDEALRATRLIALSGFAQAEDRRRAREAGFDAHIAKPPDPDRLATAVAGAGTVEPRSSDLHA